MIISYFVVSIIYDYDKLSLIGNEIFDSIISVFILIGTIIYGKKILRYLQNLESFLKMDLESKKIQKKIICVVIICISKCIYNIIQMIYFL